MKRELFCCYFGILCKICGNIASLQVNGAAHLSPPNTRKGASFNIIKISFLHPTNG